MRELRAGISMPLLCALFSLLHATAGFGQPQVWLAPRSALNIKSEPSGTDFMKLFEDSAPWENVAQHISVF